MSDITILIADDHQLFGEGLCRVLDSEEGLRCIGSIDNLENLLDMARQTTPDLILVSITLLEMSGSIQNLSMVREATPSTSIVILTHSECDYCLINAIAAGAAGYLLKDMPRANLIRTLHVIHNGVMTFDAKVAGDVLCSIAQHKVKTGALGISDLHEREVQVLTLASEGKSNKEIGRELNISHHTVASHLVHIFAKLEVGSRTEAITYALSKGWIISPLHDGHHPMM